MKTSKRMNENVKVGLVAPVFNVGVPMPPIKPRRAVLNEAVKINILDANKVQKEKYDKKIKK